MSLKLTAGLWSGFVSLKLTAGLWSGFVSLKLTAGLWVCVSEANYRTLVWDQSTGLLISCYLSAGGHVDPGDLVRPVGENVNVNIETNEEVLLRRQQEGLQEPDVPAGGQRSECCFQGGMDTTAL